MESATSPLLVPVPEARAMLGGIGHTTIYELFRSHQLTRVNIGRRAFVTAQSLEDYVNRLKEAAATA